MEGGRDIPTSADVLLETPITHVHIKMFVRCVFWPTGSTGAEHQQVEGGGEGGTQGYSNISFDQRWGWFIFSQFEGS